MESITGRISDLRNPVQDIAHKRHAFPAGVNHTVSVDGDGIAIGIGYAGGAQFLIEVVGEAFRRDELELRVIRKIEIEVNEVGRSWNGAIQKQIRIANWSERCARRVCSRGNLGESDLGHSNRHYLLALWRVHGLELVNTSIRESDRDKVIFYWLQAIGREEAAPLHFFVPAFT